MLKTLKLNPGINTIIKITEIMISYFASLLLCIHVIPIYAEEGECTIRV